MGNDHDHTHGANKKVLLISFFIISAYMIVELIGGIMTNSLALLSDAGHMLSDAISLGVGVLAFSFGEKVANQSKTYGYKRFEILAAAFNGITIIIIALYIFYDAYISFTYLTVFISSIILLLSFICILVILFFYLFYF